MNPETYFTSSKEEHDMIRRNPETILSVLSSHHIALWEYDISTNNGSFTEDYFHILGLDEIDMHFDSFEGFCRFVHPDDLVSYRAAFQKMLLTEDKTAEIVVRCVGKGGEIIWLEDHFLSYTNNSEGQPGKILVYTTNVTAKHEKEGEIKRLEERNRKIVEALPEFIFIIDDNFFIRDVLMASDTVLLHPLEELKGADGRTIYTCEVSELFLLNIRQCLADGLLKKIEYPLYVDQQIFYFQARIVPFEEHTAMVLIHDISDRVHHMEELIEAKQRAEEAAQMKSVFLANMSHEIRTPLNAIVGFSEIIALSDNEEEKLEYIEIIQKNSNLLLQLINDILDLSRIESGKTEMNLQLINITKLVDEVEKVQHLKMNEGVKLRLVSPQKAFWLSTDRNRLMQVLFNFLSNATKNTKKGEITLGLEQKGDWVKLYVSDTGCGISKEKLPLIFGRFEKLNDFVQGTGLGLSICKSIVERLGGYIDVTSELGEGSTFALYLPYNNPD